MTNDRSFRHSSFVVRQARNASLLLPAKPTDEQIRNVIAAQRSAPFSYSFVGASRDDTQLVGYKRDHNRICLGAGEATFNRAVAAVQRWEMFNLGWMQLYWPTT